MVKNQVKCHSFLRWLHFGVEEDFHLKIYVHKYVLCKNKFFVFENLSNIFL